MEEQKSNNVLLPKVNNCFHEFYLKSSIGIQITTPMVLGHIKCVNYDYKQTWAEKRAKELILKLQKRKATLNKFKVIMLMIPSATLILCLVLGFAIIIRIKLIEIILGIVGGQLMILAYYFWADKFECDAEYIVAKHKGKIYDKTLHGL